MSVQGRLSRSSWIITATLAVVLSHALTLSAQTTADRLKRSVLRIDVPDQQPQNWPFRDIDWIPRERAEFERLYARWKKASAAPADADWQRIRYLATLSGDTLTAGRFHAELRQSTSQARFLQLGTPSLAIEEITWGSKPAIWGADLEGRSWLKLNEQEDRAEGRWTARGRPLISGVVFELELLPAALSELELLTPRGYRVTSDVGEVSESAVEGNLSKWRIYLGSQTRCRLILSNLEEPTRSGRPTVLYGQELAVTVSQEELQLLQELRLESLDGEIDQLTVSLPRHVEIASVVYGDKPSETPLKWELLPGAGPLSQLMVTLPEGVRSRSIRIEGFQRRVVGEPLTVPQFILEGGVWLEGRLNVNVRRPLEIRSLRPTGYRQDAPVTLTGADSSSEGELISFQQLTPRAQLVLNLERPTPERAAHALNVLTVEQNVWTLTTELAWESRAGAVFNASCRFPNDWRVVSVVQLSGGRDRRELVGWKVQAHPESGQVLLMEFPDGLTLGRVEPIRVIARHIQAEAATPAYLPLMIPLECEASEVVLSVPSDVYDRFSSPPWASFERFDPETAAAVWNTLPAWGEVQRPVTPPRALLHLATSESLISVPTMPAGAIAQADVRVSLKLGAEQVEERWEIRLDTLPPDRRLELFFPRSAAGIDWTWGAEQPRPVKLTRVATSSVSSRRWPADGELCAITLPEHDVGRPAILTGVRQGNWTERTTVPLVFMPQATRFQGHVSLISETTDDYELREQAVGEVSGQRSVPEPAVKEIPAGSDLQWDYLSWDREWVIARRQPDAAAARQATFALDSILSADENGFDYHKLTISACEATEFGELRFRLESPAEFIAVLRDGKRLPYAAAGAEFVVAASTGHEGRDLDLLYRVPVTLAFCRTEHRLILPTLDWQCAGFTWSLCVPPAGRFASAPLGLPLSPEIARPGWYRRLWGPIARQSGEKIFLPFVSWNSEPPRAPAVSLRIDSRSWRGPNFGFQFPEGWSVYHAADVALPVTQRFECWSRDSLDMATWLAALSFVPLGVVLRWKPWQRRALWAGLAVGVTASLAVFGPEPWSDVWGGAFFGLLLALLLPKSCLRTWPLQELSPRQVAGSTATFRQQVASVALLLALGLAVRFGFADDPATRTVAEGDGESPLRVLVPVDADGQPSSTMPLVFVSPELSAELQTLEQQTSRAPDQLIHSIDYVVYADQSRRLAMKVKYQIDQFPTDQPAVLRVPVGEDWLKGLEACTVNGRPQQPTRAADGAVLTLSLQETSTAGAVNAASHRHDVVLDVRLPAGIDDDHHQLELNAFPVLNSQLSWQFPARTPHVEVPTAKGAVSISLDQRLLEAQLGAVRQISVVCTKEDGSLARPAKTELKLSQMLTLRPTLAQAAFRVLCKVLEGAPERMEFRLPPGAVLRDISGHRLLRTTSRRESDGTMTVIVEFSEPQRREFVVEGELILPRSSEDAAVEAPRLQIRCGEAADSLPLRSQLAVACGPDFIVKLMNPDVSSVLPITIEQFVSNWGDTVPTQWPQAAFQVQEGAQPVFRLVAKKAEQEVVSWHEDVQLSARRLDWRLTADVKTAELPSLTHTVLLDRRLKIESASVQENGVERLWRWSVTPSIGFSQNRVTLFLNRESTGTFRVRIHASMPIRPSSPVALPIMHFEDVRSASGAAQSVPGTMSLFHQTGYRLELEGRQTTADDGTALPSPVVEGETWKRFKTLRIAEGETGLLARLEPADGRSNVQFGLYDAPSGKSWSLKGWLRLVPQEGTREIRVSIPQWLSECRFTAEDGVAQPIEYDEFGQRMFSMECAADGSARVLRWECETSAPEESDWNLELPTVRQASSVETFIPWPADTEWTVDDAESLPPDDVPADVQALFPPDSLSGNMRVHRVAASRVHLLRTDNLSPDGKISVLLVDHHLCGMPDGAWHGQTNFYPAMSAGTIDLLVPDELEAVGLIIGGRLLPRHEWQRAGQHLRIPQAGRYHAVSLLWRQPAPWSRFVFAQRQNLALPKCVQQRPSEILLTITAPQNRLLINIPDMQRRDPLEGAFERLEILSRRYARQLSAESAEPGLSDVIWREYQQTATRLSRRVSRGQLAADSKQRWEAITKFVNQLKPVASASLPANPAENNPTAWENAASWQGRMANDAASVSCWSIARQPYRWAAAALVLLIAGWVLPRFFRWQLGPWLEVHHDAAWVVFGLVWWLCWSPSIVGFAIIAGALFRGLWQRRAGWTLSST